MLFCYPQQQQLAFQPAYPTQWMLQTQMQQPPMTLQPSQPQATLCQPQTNHERNDNEVQIIEASV
jgi:hypothetical protein